MRGKEENIYIYIWEARGKKLCGAQQSCSKKKKGGLGRMLGRGMRRTEYHKGTNYAVE